MHSHYPPKINCTEEEMLVEIKEDWPSIGKLWMVEVNKGTKGKRPLDQLSVWQQFVKEHSNEFPNMCQLIQIMVATAANTSPLERSYTKLQMVAFKQRNHFESKNLETYLLAASKTYRICGGVEITGVITVTRVFIPNKRHILFCSVVGYIFILVLVLFTSPDD